MNHYRCYRCFLPRSGREIITNTIKFIPQKIQFPNINIEKKLENLFVKISDILQSNVTQIPIKPMKYQALQHTIKYLAKVFNNHHVPVPKIEHIPKDQWPYYAPPPRVQINSIPKDQWSYNGPSPRVQFNDPRVPNATVMHNHSMLSPNNIRQHPIHQPYTASLNAAHSHDPKPCQSTRIHKPSKNNHKLFHIFDDSGNKLNIDALL